MVEREAGRQVGESARDDSERFGNAEERRDAVIAVLSRHGYQPEVGKRKEIRLSNCPFHRLAEEHRTLVCGMNLDFLAGMLDGMGPTVRLTARLAPQPGHCCVRISVN